jgi:putative transposase
MGIETALDDDTPKGDNSEESPSMLQREPLAMTQITQLFCTLRRFVCLQLTLVRDAGRCLLLSLCPSPALAAENLFLRKQLVLYQERQVKPKRATDATRLALVWLSRWFEWRKALCVVQPETFIRWHRQAFRLFWSWKSRPGRPTIPPELQALIRRMALENPTWGQERIANELLLKLGLRVSPRTVRKYMPSHCVGNPGQRRQTQRWSTFLRNHAKGILACDFCAAITATFQMLYVFVVIEHRSRRPVHVNVTAHPTAQWTMQQCREAIPADHSYRILIHDRDAIFSKEVDQRIGHMGLHVIQTPVRTNTGTDACGQYDLRTYHRDDATRMSGLFDPAG